MMGIITEGKLKHCNVQVKQMCIMSIESTRKLKVNKILSKRIMTKNFTCTSFGKNLQYYHE